MPSLFTPGDLAFFQKKNIEVYTYYFYPIDVYKIKPKPVNTVYGEDPNKDFETPYQIEAFIPDLPEWTANMTRFGLDSQRDFPVYFSRDLLTQRGVVWPDIGDHIGILAGRYRIMDVNPEPKDYGTNLQIPLSHVCILHRIRPENPQHGTAVIKDY